MKEPCPYRNLLKMEITEAREGHARMTLPFREDLTNPNGVVHGGVISSMADAALAVALDSLLGRSDFSTAKLEVRFRSPTKGNPLVCEATIDSKRGGFYFGKAIVREEGGKIVAEVDGCLSAPQGAEE